MKTLYIIIGSLILCFSYAQAQSLPEVSFHDFGFHKQPQQVLTKYYSIEPNGVEEIDKAILTFNEEGNILSRHRLNYLENTSEQAQAFYKKGKIIKEVWVMSDTLNNRTYTFRYNNLDQLDKEKIISHGETIGEIDYKYSEGKLSKIIGAIEGYLFISERSYDIHGSLYKETYTEKIYNQDDIISHHFFLEDKEILSYTEPKSDFFSNIFLDDIEVFFKLDDDQDLQERFWKGVDRYNYEAPYGDLPFDLKKYSEQTIQVYHKNKDKLIPYRMNMFRRNEHKDLMVLAHVDVKTKTVVGLKYYQIMYADQQKSGSLKYNSSDLEYFNDRLTEW